MWGRTPNRRFANFWAERPARSLRRCRDPPAACGRDDRARRSSEDPPAPRHVSKRKRNPTAGPKGTTRPEIFGRAVFLGRSGIIYIYLRRGRLRAGCISHLLSRACPAAFCVLWFHWLAWSGREGDRTKRLALGTTIDGVWAVQNGGLANMTSIFPENHYVTKGTGSFRNRR